MNKLSRRNKFNKYNAYSEIIVYFKNTELKCLVDNDDLGKLINFGKWYVDNTGYVKNSHKSQKIHRLILNNPKNKCVDHINGNILDNRKDNLRIVSQSENRQNQNKNYIRNKSGQIGVSYRVSHKGTNFEKHYWCVKIKKNNKIFYYRNFNLSDLELAIKHAKIARAYLFPFSKEAREVHISNIPDWLNKCIQKMYTK